MDRLKIELERHVRSLDAIGTRMAALAQTAEHREDPIKRLETSQIFVKKACHELAMAQIAL